MLGFIIDIFTDPIAAVIELVYWIFRGGKDPEKSKLFPQEDVGPITEEETLRDRLEDRTRCLNRRM